MARVDGAPTRSSTSPPTTASPTRCGGRTRPTATPWSRRSRRIPALYIADGHHRAASAMRARAALREAAAGGGPIEADTFLAVAFPDDQMQVLPYHRVVKDLGGPDAGRRSSTRSGRRTRSRPARDTPGGPGRGRDVPRRPLARAPPPARRARRRGRGPARRLAPPGPGARAAARHRRPADGQADRLRRRHPRARRARRGRRRRHGGRRVRDAPGQRRGPDGDRRRGRDHAPQVDLVRAEAAGRPAHPPHRGGRTG